MSDNNLGAYQADSTEDIGVSPGQAQLQRRLIQARTSAGDATARARLAASQRGLSQARAAAWDATGRARSAAAARRTATPTDATPDTATTGTLVDRARAYRPHLLTATAAVLGVLIVVLGRRAAARRADAVIDAVEIDVVEIQVSDGPLDGEPLED